MSEAPERVVREKGGKIEVDELEIGVREVRVEDRRRSGVGGCSDKVEIERIGGREKIE